MVLPSGRPRACNKGYPCINIFHPEEYAALTVDGGPDPGPPWRMMCLELCLF